ncbi:unnamed protein product [Symbiodinium natans]|uniref:FHA domain-containing protein n=1 Tax=Symbiodinium natans TaxID=878477 RepID=A0A812JEP0_9DINO|nr:unnamed protein product [Symbiodinium natans]
MVAMGRQEERCQIIACRKGQDVSTGRKFILKSGDVVRIGRGNDNEVILDYEGVSKHHAEIFMRQKLPEEVILGSDLKMTGLLSIRDLNSRNGLSIHKSPTEQDVVPTIGAFDRIVPGNVQAVQDGWSVLVPAKSRHQDKQMSVEQRLLTLYVSSVMVDVPVPAPVREPPPILAPPSPRPPAQVTPAPFVPPAADPEVAKAKPKKKKKPKEDERPAARPKSRPEGLATVSGEAWPPALPRDESDGSDGGQDIPPPKASKGSAGPGQRPLTSPRPERRRSDKVEVSSDEEGPALRLTQANVAKVSAAAAVAVGVSEPGDVDPDLRSISPISTPGVFPWQAGKKAKKKPRAESPCSAEAQVRKKRKGETGKTTKASKKLVLTAPGQGMQWDPYMMPRAAEPCEAET